MENVSLPEEHFPLTMLLVMLSPARAPSWKKKERTEQHIENLVIFLWWTILCERHHISTHLRLNRWPSKKTWRLNQMTIVFSIYQTRIIRPLELPIDRKYVHGLAHRLVNRLSQPENISLTESPRSNRFKRNHLIQQDESRSNPLHVWFNELLLTRLIYDEKHNNLFGRFTAFTN